MSRRLFVLVRSDLSRSQQAVQAGHAVAAFCSREFRRHHWNGREMEVVPARWDGETLVYLKTDPVSFKEAYTDCEEAYPFYEPDIGNEMTAFATLSPPDWFDFLKLV